MKTTTIVSGAVAALALVWLMWSMITATVMADDSAATHFGDIITDGQISALTQMAISAALVATAATASIWSGVRLYLLNQSSAGRR